ncbi:uncharacterized protein [Nicotiana sylvestris]|uniref:uncharacterized protein n=1 Tax=Nicotiana sylvestris TaxID=4096 RepID=UPI00388CABFB
MPRDSLSAHVYVSTPVGDPIVVDHVYRACVVIIGGLETHVDFLFLDMVDFDVILGMDWVISYMKAWRMVDKGYLAYLAYVRDSSAEVPSMDSMPVAREFLEVDPKKIAVVKDWPRPTSVTDIQSFLCLAGYYHRFVKGFSSIAAPMTRLTQKGAQFRWYDEYEASFQKIKKALTTTPMLVLPTGSRPYTVYSDALGIGLGAVLMQNYKDRLRTAQSRQKSYSDRKVRNVAFVVGERVLLRVSSMKGVMRFGKKGKLRPRFIGPFEILDREGEVAYRLALLLSLSDVHPVFHMSMLRKYHGDPSHVLEFSTVQLDKDLTYEEEPVAILDWQVRQLRSKTFPSVFVQ